MSSDIVWRLRVLGDCLCTNGCHVVGHPAADEIERLRAHNLALSETSLGELFDEVERLRALADQLAEALAWELDCPSDAATTRTMKRNALNAHKEARK